jgi:hypothetical protein
MLLQQLLTQQQQQALQQLQYLQPLQPLQQVLLQTQQLLLLRMALGGCQRHMQQWVQQQWRRKSLRCLLLQQLGALQPWLLLVGVCGRT